MGAIAPWLAGGWTFLTVLGMTLAGWVMASTVMQVARRLKAGTPPVSFWGMHLAHFGVAVFIVGITLVGGYQEEKDVRMEPGDVTEAGGYQFKFLGVRSVDGPNYQAQRGEFQVARNGSTVATLFPEKRNYRSTSMPMTEAAIEPGLTRDVYVSLGEPLEGKAWAVRVYYKPFVDWIWGGALLMAIGGALAIADRRYRIKVKASQALAALRAAA
jgi:cytochrome c-type biogenesis protein CcmF